MSLCYAAQDVSGTAPAPALRTKADRIARAREGVVITVDRKSTPKLKVLETSVFTRLPYYDPVKTTGYDPMHTIGGVIEDLFKCAAGNRITENQLQYEKEHNRWVCFLQAACSALCCRHRHFHDSAGRLAALVAQALCGVCRCARHEAAVFPHQRGPGLG